jgi:hypothetical protein
MILSLPPRGDLPTLSSMLSLYTMHNACLEYMTRLCSSWALIIRWMGVRHVGGRRRSGPVAFAHILPYVHRNAMREHQLLCQSQCRYKRCMNGRTLVRSVEGLQSITNISSG